MMFSVQADNLKLLKEAVESNCDEVRFGPEFCEYKLPSLDELEEAYMLSIHSNKVFTYVTPRISENILEKMRAQLQFLNEKKNSSVVINDFGVLNLIGQYPNLKPRLGRQLMYVPARCPWEEIKSRQTKHETSFLSKRKVEKIFYQTSLNYLPTIRIYQGYGVQSIDVDFIQPCFPYFSYLAENGFNISIHLHLIPAAVTRRCHTARFLGEKSLEKCSRPCDTRAFLLERDLLDTKLVLYGNAVFKFTKYSEEEIKKILGNEFKEIVATMGPATSIENQEEINALKQMLQL
ncbi:MAG: hypothetical protein QG670_1730 [Thermoproteota archaeon]|nr:hypothetical protein [Thermoproteota archaeon]